MTTHLVDGYDMGAVGETNLAQKLPSAIESMHDAPGLIIDLRGNPGGMRDAAVAGL
jgi:C-terminal processing protease CtpA/Prc